MMSRVMEPVVFTISLEELVLLSVASIVIMKLMYTWQSMLKKN